MPAKFQATVTQNGMTVSQPGTSVSVTNFTRDGQRVAILNVTRSYNVRNKFGGIGLAKPLDNHGKVFQNSDEAWQFAFERGYTRKFFLKGLK